MSHEVLREALAALDRGEGFALVTVIEVDGSSPASPGQKMLVRPDGGALGTVGGGVVERRALEEAGQRLAANRSGLVSLDLDPDSPGGAGSICGGKVTLVVEIYPAAKRLLLFGAGHVSRAFAALAAQLGWPHAVIDGRAELVTVDRFPRAFDRRIEDPAALAVQVDLTGYTHLVIFTHDHTLDRAILQALAPRRFSGYVGMIGSARKWAETRRSLEAEGIPRAWLDTVRCPIGLPIGSRTPEEIAVAIAAEIIQERRPA